MSRLTAIVIGVCLSGAGFGQSVPSLGDAQAVDIRTLNVQWSPKGDCLAYSREVDPGKAGTGTADPGVAIGLYQVGAQQGSALLHLKKTDTWSIQWFESQDAAIVTVKNSDGHEKHISVYLLEAKPTSATKLFVEKAPAGETFDIDANLSPLLEHAIFYVHIGEVEYHLILPEGSNSLIRSRDLDEAQRERLVGPKWASSGTAFYIPGHKDATPMVITPNQNATVNVQVGAGSAGTSGGSGSSSGSSGTAVIQLQAVPPAYQVSGTLYVEFSIASEIEDMLASAPAEGEVGLELMPNNGILRQVRSPGPWEEPGQAETKATPQHQFANVTAGQMAGNSQSLWLISRDKSRSILVAPSAKNSWLSPSGKAIAYTVDGALFVRTFKI